MAFSIQTNVSSLVAQEHLRVNQLFQQKTINRMTSGYRINASADDAAGLSIANKYRSDITELTQGVRNANDGISALQVIDGGLANIGSTLDRLKTFAQNAEPSLRMRHPSSSNRPSRAATSSSCSHFPPSATSFG